MGASRCGSDCCRHLKEDDYLYARPYARLCDHPFDHPFDHPVGRLCGRKNRVRNDRLAAVVVVDSLQSLAVMRTVEGSGTVKLSRLAFVLPE